MVAREVPFVGNSSLLYNWKNINAFFAEYGLTTLDDYDAFWMEKASSLGFDDYRKMVSMGLQRKDKPVSMEVVEGLIEDFMDKNSLQDLVTLCRKAQVSALVNIDSPGEQKGETKTKKPPTPSKS